MNPENSQPSRILILSVLFSLLMLCSGVCLFLWNEVRQKNADVSLGQKFIGEFEKNNEPRIKAFISNLQTFAKTNPDFATILTKYGLQAGSIAPAGSLKK